MATLLGGMGEDVKTSVTGRKVEGGEEVLAERTVEGAGEHLRMMETTTLDRCQDK